MLTYVYILRISMFNNINFQYINIPVHLHNYSTKKYLHFTNQLFYTMLVTRKSG